MKIIENIIIIIVHMPNSGEAKHTAKLPPRNCTRRGTMPFRRLTKLEKGDTRERKRKTLSV